jgi:hypothetical protein
MKRHLATRYRRSEDIGIAPVVVSELKLRDESQVRDNRPSKRRARKSADGCGRKRPAR